MRCPLLIPLVILVCLFISGCSTAPKTHYLVYRSSDLSEVPSRTYRLTPTNFPAKQGGNKHMADRNSAEYKAAIQTIKAMLQTHGWTESDNPSYTLAVDFWLIKGITPPMHYSANVSLPTPKTDYYTKYMILILREYPRKPLPPAYYIGASAIDESPDFSAIPSLVRASLKSFPGTPGRNNFHYSTPANSIEQ